MKIILSIIFVLCFVQAEVRLAGADVYGREHSDPDMRPSSTTRMEDTLLKLRENTQQAVIENRKLAEKNQRFQERAAELERESGQVKNAKTQLLEKRDSALDQLKKEVSQTQLMQNEIDKLNSNISTADQQELSIKNTIISKDVEQEAVTRKIDNLRAEIRGLKGKVSSSKANAGVQHSQEYLQQKSVLENQLSDLTRINAQGDDARAEGRRLSDQVRNMRANTDTLREKQSGLIAELTDLRGEQQRLQNSYAQRQEKQGREFSQLDAQIAELTANRDELLEAGKRAQLLQKELALSIPEDLLQNDVAKLMTERDILNKRLGLLIDQENLLTKNSSRNTNDDEVKKFEDRVSALNKEQNDLLLLVEQKGHETKQAEGTLAGLQEFVPRIKKAVQVLKERNDRKLQMEDARLSKENASRNKERLSIMDKNTMMKDRLNVLRKELDDLSLAGNLLVQQQQAKTVHGSYDLEKLKAELGKLALNKDYLVSTLKAVRSKLKDSDSVVLPWSNNEELDLKNHVISLRDENKHLQVELLSVGMEQDKMDGGRQIKQGGS